MQHRRMRDNMYWCGADSLCDSIVNQGDATLAEGRGHRHDGFTTWPGLHEGRVSDIPRLGISGLYQGVYNKNRSTQSHYPHCSTGDQSSIGQESNGLSLRPAFRCLRRKNGDTNISPSSPTTAARWERG